MKINASNFNKFFGIIDIIKDGQYWEKLGEDQKTHLLALTRKII